VSVQIQDLSAQLKQALYAKLGSNLVEAMDLYDEKLKEAINIQGPPRSSPGSPPHKDSGYLHDKSLSHPVDRVALEAAESSDAPYAAELEIEKDREFFIPTLIQQSDEMARLICDT
jgi:hypothetical protein